MYYISSQFNLAMASSSLLNPLESELELLAEEN